VRLIPTPAVASREAARKAAVPADAAPTQPAELPFLTDPAVRAAALRRAMRLVRTRADAEDAVQEATVRALRYRASFLPGAAGTPWFLQIVSRVSLAGALPRDPRGEPAPTPVDFEQSYALHAAIDALPPSQRRVVVLHDLDGLTTREIAALDGVPHSTVRTRLRRARLALRVALEGVAAA
jgi:RNA polymerase sigma-70 factor, ECF subfamily